MKNSIPAFNSNGFIHTAELRIKWRDGIDVQTNLNDKTNPKRINKWQAGVNETGKSSSMVFNPNHECFFIKQSARWSEPETCYSLFKFNQILNLWASEKGYCQSDIHVSRIDFAVDHKDPQNAAFFKKLSDLLITSFVVKHKVTAKAQYYTTDIIHRTPKSICATAKPFEVTCYNKHIQSPQADAIWRFEMRYFKDLRHKKHIETAVKDMLLLLSEELNSLKEYYYATIETLTAELSKAYQALQEKSKDKINVNQFITQNADRFFSRKQIELFFTLLEYEENSAKNAANNYSDRVSHLYVNKTSYVRFIDMLQIQIQAYIQNDA